MRGSARSSASTLPTCGGSASERPDLWDANVNGWLHGNDLAGYPPDGRKFLVRLFQADGDGLGVARAVLSDSYKVIDNLDALMATLDGIHQAGAEVEFDGLDLTERRLYARVVAPQVRAWAPVLLAGYRSPFGGETYIPGRTWTPERRPRRRGAGGTRLRAGERAGAVRRVRDLQQRGDPLADMLRHDVAHLHRPEERDQVLGNLPGVVGSGRQAPAGDAAAICLAHRLRMSACRGPDHPACPR